MLIFWKCAPVAQLDRASGYEPEGREFESPRAHQFSNKNVVFLWIVMRGHPRATSLLPLESKTYRSLNAVNISCRPSLCE